MSKDSPGIHTYLNEDGFELTAVPGSRMDKVLAADSKGWARVVERPAAKSKPRAPESPTDPE